MICFYLLFEGFDRCYFALSNLINLFIFCRFAPLSFVLQHGNTFLIDIFHVILGISLQLLNLSVIFEQNSKFSVFGYCIGICQFGGIYCSISLLLSVIAFEGLICSSIIGLDYFLTICYQYGSEGSVRKVAFDECAYYTPKNHCKPQYPLQLNKAK